MRFATYGRKSVYSDKSDSVNNQERMCREYAEFRFKDIEAFEVYSDEGYTGANTDRPGLKRLLEDVGDGLVDALIVYQLDRLSRNVKDFANIYASLEEKGVMFISIKENIDTATPIGKAMMYVTMVFAQMERETIAARVTDNLEGLARKGFWTGGKPPQGYRLERIEAEGKKHVTLAIDPDEAAHCAWLFDTFLESGCTISRLQTEFRKQGIRTSNGAFFAASRIHKILTTPYGVEATPEMYDYFSNKGCQMDPGSPREAWDGAHGVMVYGRSTERGADKKHALQPPDKWIVCVGHHQPFIPADKWLAVQERFRGNCFDKSMKYDVPLLKGVVRCKCGCLMGVARKKLKARILSHYCCRKRNQQGPDACDMRYVKCDILDGKVLEIFRRIETDRSVIMEYTAAGQPQGRVRDVRRLEADAARIQAKIDRLAGSLADAEGSTASKYIIAQIEKEDLSLAAVKREIGIAKAEARKGKKAEQSIGARADAIARLVQGLGCFTDVERNAVAKEVIQECRWDGSELFLRL